MKHRIRNKILRLVSVLLIIGTLISMLFPWEVLATSGLVGTTAVQADLWQVNNKMNFYANGRHWVFYDDGTNGEYVSSTDGLTFNAPISVGTVKDSSVNLSVFYDGIYVHYARGASGGYIYYRRGLPNSDGTITWSAVEQAVLLSGINSSPITHIVVTTDGHAAIEYISNAGGGQPYVVINANTNGTWSTSSNTMIANIALNDFDLARMTNGQLYIVYTDSAQNPNDIIYGRLYSGGSWGGQETVSTDYASGPMCATNSGDVVNVVYATNVGTKKIRNTTRDIIGVWSDVIISTITSFAYPTITDTGNGNLVLFYTDQNQDKIYTAKKTGGSWNSPSTYLTVPLAASNGCVTSVYSSAGVVGSVLGLVYETMSGSYNLCYAYSSSPIPSSANQLAQLLPFLFLAGVIVLMLIFIANSSESIETLLLIVIIIVIALAFMSVIQVTVNAL